jgi:hypothetical protein
VHGLRRQAIALRALLGGELSRQAKWAPRWNATPMTVVNASIGLEAIA